MRDLVSQLERGLLNFPISRLRTRASHPHLWLLLQRFVESELSI